MGYLKNELSLKSKYHLSKHRYLELKHFCLQYPEWKQRLKEINDIWAVDYSKIRVIADIREIETLAIERESLLNKINRVEWAVRNSSIDIYKWLLLGITEERSFVWLSTVMQIPCGKDYYYERYRKVFYILSQDLQFL